MDLKKLIKKAFKIKGKPVPHSFIVHKYLNGLRGIEIGGAAHNNFGLDALNVDILTHEGPNDSYRNEQLKYGTKVKPVDIISSGDALPFNDNRLDFVFSSHVLEHFFDPIKALKEWMRVVKPGGYIVMVVPHKERTPDKEKPRTPLQELIDRHEGKIINTITEDNHFSIWITEDVLELCKYLNYNVVEYLDTDDAVGNGFLIVIKKDSNSKEGQ